MQTKILSISSICLNQIHKFFKTNYQKLNLAQVLRKGLLGQFPNNLNSKLKVRVRVIKLLLPEIQA